VKIIFISFRQFHSDRACEIIRKVKSIKEQNFYCEVEKRITRRSKKLKESDEIWLNFTSKVTKT
jgi:hypothetical protein